MPTIGTGQRPHSLKAYLTAFAVLVALPVTALAGVLLLNSANEIRTQAEARLIRLAAAASESVDRDVERHLLVLNTLATSSSFGGDWATFHERALRALQGDGYIVVADSAFRQLVNTYVPYGEAPARTGDLETAERILVSKRPEVSSVFTSLVTKGPVINFDLPIVRDGQVEYILMYGRPTAHMSRILRGESLDPGWTGRLFDRHGTLVASSIDETTEHQIEPGPNGLSQHTGSAGTTVLRATHTSEITGWTIAIDVPLSVINSEVNRSLQWWVVLAVGALLLAIGLGVVFAQFISRQLRDAAAYATALGREETVPALKAASLHEIGDLTDAFQKAGTEMTRRMQHQRLLSGELNHRVKNLLIVVQAIVKLTFADSRPAAEHCELVLRRLQALSRSQDLLMESNWTNLNLRKIVDLEVAPFANRVRCEGPDMSISATNVQNLGLLLHELATNALKYGALREGAGTVALRWRVEQAAGGKRFKLRWKEHCDPVASSVDKAGFGSMLLRTVFGAPDTTYRLSVEPDGLVYELDAALHVVTGRKHPGASRAFGAKADVKSRSAAE
jgi:two-component sensor histidine kinase